MVALVSLKYFNIINLLLRLGFYTLILSSVAEYAGKLVLGTGFVTKFRPAYVSFFEQHASIISAHLVDYLKVAELKVQDLVYSKDLENTFKVAIVTYFLYKITSWFSIFTILMTSTILAFSLPVVYESNKDQIDALVKDSSKVLKLKALQFQEVAKEKSAPYLQKLGPLGSFIQSKLPKNRTASTTVGEVKPSMDEPVKAASTGIELPSVPTSAPGEVDINELESELKQKTPTAAL